MSKTLTLIHEQTYTELSVSNLGKILQIIIILKGMLVTNGLIVIKFGLINHMYPLVENNRGYCIAARRYKISFQVTKNILQVTAANE